MPRQTRLKLIEKTTPILEPKGLKVADIWWGLEDHVTIVTVFLKRLVEGEPIDMNVCVDASRALNEAEIFDDLFKGNYELEISSCPKGYALRESEDFKPWFGHEIRIKLEKSSGGQKAGRGELKTVDNDLIQLDTERGHWEFNVSELDRAWVEDPEPAIGET